MLFVTPSQLSPSREGFANYYLQNGAGAGAGGDSYQPIGAFDGVRLETGNSVSQWKYNTPNEPMMGPEFKPVPIPSSSSRITSANLSAAVVPSVATVDASARHLSSAH